VPGLKTNERPGTRAVLRHCRMSAYKARQVLDLIRGVEYERAKDILRFCDREAAEVIGKLLASAAANAEHNDGQAAEELFVSACYADEGSTAKRWRPRARGRATRIRKRTCHITVIVSRLPEEELRRRRAKEAADNADRRARRVAGARRSRKAAEGATDELSAPSADDLDLAADEFDDEDDDDFDSATDRLAAEVLADDDEDEEGDEVESEAAGAVEATASAGTDAGEDDAATTDAPAAAAEEED
jgi:large subunit ribosomal protein L22